MKIKKIKSAQIPNCPYCKMELKKVPAVWHLTGANKQACDRHKPTLEDIRDQHIVDEKKGYSEADYKTWLRL